MVGVLPARRVPLFTKLTVTLQRIAILRRTGGDCHPKKTERFDRIIGAALAGLCGPL